MAGISAYGQRFDPDAAIAEWKRGFDERKKRAAQHLLSALLARMPAKTGEMKRKTSVKLTSSGFLLLVELYYSYFVDQGHKTGKNIKRHESQALRSIAKELRRIRKDTGDLNLKQQEKEYRKAAKAKLLEPDARKMVPGLEFIKKTLDAERDTVIAILAGQA